MATDVVLDSQNGNALPRCERVTYTPIAVQPTVRKAVLALPAKLQLAVLLDADKLFCKLRFRYCLNCPNRSDRSQHRLRVSPEGGSILLRPFPARAFAGTAPPRHRGTTGGHDQVAPRRRARSRTAGHLSPHGGIPAARPRDLRFPSWMGRPKTARSISLPRAFPDR